MLLSIILFLIPCGLIISTTLAVDLSPRIIGANPLGSATSALAGATSSLPVGGAVSGLTGGASNPLASATGTLGGLTSSAGNLPVVGGLAGSAGNLPVVGGLAGGLTGGAPGVVPPAAPVPPAAVPPAVVPPAAVPPAAVPPAAVPPAVVPPVAVPPAAVLPSPATGPSSTGSVTQTIQLIDSFTNSISQLLSLIQSFLNKNRTQSPSAQGQGAQQLPPISGFIQRSDSEDDILSIALKQLKEDMKLLSTSQNNQCLNFGKCIAKEISKELIYGANRRGSYFENIVKETFGKFLNYFEDNEIVSSYPETDCVLNYKDSCPVIEKIRWYNQSA